MNRLMMLGFIVLLAATLSAQTDRPAGAVDREQIPLDLTSVAIKSPVAKEILGTDRIRVRNPRTTYVPQGALPVLKVAGPSRNECQRILERILEVNDQQPGRIRPIGRVMSFQLKDVSAWIHPASGGFKYTRTKPITVQPTQFENFQGAVQAGLDYIAKNNLVDLVEGEELDITSVSAIQNALTEVETPEKPLEAFVSGYYVSFGRRFKGVPVIGSHLTLRFDGAGNVEMINKNWRRIMGATEGVPVRPESLRDLIFQHPSFREAYGNQNLSPQDIHISFVRAGYIEAPFDYAQELFRPGVLVTFWVGETRDEMDAELLLSLEKGMDDEQLLGRPAP